MHKMPPAYSSGRRTVPDGAPDGVCREFWRLFFAAGTLCLPHELDARRATLD